MQVADLEPDIGAGQGEFPFVAAINELNVERIQANQQRQQGLLQVAQRRAVHVAFLQPGPDPGAAPHPAGDAEITMAELRGGLEQGNA